MRRCPPPYLIPLRRTAHFKAESALAAAAAATGKQDADKITEYITKQMRERIMVIDGAMGTTVQQYKFTEEDFRGA